MTLRKQPHAGIKPGLHLCVPCTRCTTSFRHTPHCGSTSQIRFSVHAPLKRTVWYPWVKNAFRHYIKCELEVCCTERRFLEWKQKSLTINNGWGLVNYSWAVILKWCAWSEYINHTLIWSLHCSYCIGCFVCVHSLIKMLLRLIVCAEVVHTIACGRGRGDDKHVCVHCLIRSALFSAL